MSDEELEKFEVTDYDLENEFNINRPNRRISKNKQIYGIWADDSGEEDDGGGGGGGGGAGGARPSFKGAGGSGGGKHNYSAPVSFVSGGVQQAGKDKASKTEGSGDKTDEDDDEDDNDDRKFHRRGKNDIGNSSSESEEEDRRHGMGKMQTQSVNIVEGEIAGLRKKRPIVNPALMNKGMGSWERHTRGIGAKLLLQMGFQPGKGLGKDLQGIAAPVEAHLRKGRGAIGAYGPEKGQRVADVQPDSEEEESREFAEKLSQWRKDDVSTKKKKVRYVYKSVDEVLEQGKTTRKEYSQLSKVKVIDMTGPQQRVLSGYHAIAGQQRPADEWELRKDKKFVNFALPELQHNLNLLMDMCEQDIIQNDRKLRYTSDRIVMLEQEEVSLNKVMEQEMRHMTTLDTVLNTVQQLIDQSNDIANPLTLDRAAEAFKELQEKYYEEYRLYELGDLGSKIVSPLLKNRLSTWAPLENPREPMSLFKQWQDILEDARTQTLSAMTTQDPYHRLVWEAWMPSVRTAVNNWNCRTCEPMIEFLELWLPLVPAWVLDNIRDQLVLPRMQHEVEEWNPLTDTVPIHAWIHPWLPLLGNRLESTVYPVIRHKLSKALVNWHPSDTSAKLMLLPWHGVFSRGDMDAFLVKNIMPKLQLAMQELVINPHQQHLEQWNWVMDWADLLPVHTLASLLEKHFFPKWLQILTLWLNHAPNYDEITNWYMGWKGMVSEPLLAQPAVKEQFRKALELMNRAVTAAGQSLVHQPGAVESVSYLTNIEQTSSVNSAPTQRARETRFELLAEAVRTASQIPQGFKELIQKRCEERGIVFVPLPNRYREGKQIYRCGKIQVYIDRSVVFVSENGSVWSPTSLNNVLDMAV
ncbi:tuftelin-interacting protein 11 [Periplaneta americana]|uniref:tuftelin-interacting protein 11 n=1 Tax=Periplaneta americana TaxID=6978 RepID=UPI0037E72CB8